MRVRRTPIIGLGAATLVLSALSPGAAAGRVDPLKERAGNHPYLIGAVTALSPTTAFYAGEHGSLHRTRFKEWDGQSWTNFPFAGPRSQPTAIDATDPGNVWAVGRSDFVAHFDGSEWHHVHLPRRLGPISELSDVTMTAPEDVWVVGHYTPGDSIASVVLHWNGSVWQRIQTPVGALLTTVAAAGPDDVWTAGLTFDGWVTMHWDGERWTTTHPSYTLAFSSISAVSTDDVWAVGNNPSSGNDPIIEHWDGTEWTVVPNPGKFAGLVKVDAVAPDDVWTVGVIRPGGGGIPKTFIEHWDGRQWSIVDSPSPGTGWNYLEDVSGDSPTDAWAFGTFSSNPICCSGPEKLLFLHWDGRTWTRLHHLN